MSHGDFAAQLAAILTKRDKDIITIKAEGWKYGVSLAAQENSLKALKPQSFGSGMSSEAVTAATAVREELRSTLNSQVVQVRKASIKESQAAFDKIEV